MLRIQKISDYGTSHPAVARTTLQAYDLLRAFGTADNLRDDICDTLMGVSRHLIKCVQVHERVQSAIRQAKDGFSEVPEKQQTIALTVPSVPDLESDVESFLQSLKLGIRDSAGILSSFFGVSFDHRFHKILTWARGQFSDTDDVFRCVQNWEPWVKEMVAMRNAVDHPNEQPRGRLVITNFDVQVSSENPDLCEPTWYLSGDAPMNLLEGFEASIEKGILLSEDLLAVCLLKNRGDRLVTISEIPEHQRDPRCPVRLVAVPSSASRNRPCEERDST